MQAQNFGVYVTVDDYLNKTPLKGIALKETSGKGASILTLTLPDGTTKEFKDGTYWGCRKPVDKRSEEAGIITDYRSYKGGLLAIYTAGELYAYQNYNAGFYKCSDGQVHFKYRPIKYRYISKGATGPIIELILQDARKNLNSYLDPGFAERITAFYEANWKANRGATLEQAIDYYNNLKRGEPQKPIIPVEVMGSDGFYGAPLPIE